MAIDTNRVKGSRFIGSRVELQGLGSYNFGFCGLRVLGSQSFRVSGLAFEN